MKEPQEKVCPDCYAHYPEDFEHTCPPWLKALVDYKRRKDAAEAAKKNES